VSYPASLSKSGTEISPGVRSSKKSTYLNELDRGKPLVEMEYIPRSSEELKILQRGLEFDNFKLRLTSGSFKRIS
jgi:hypothetical protein